MPDPLDKLALWRFCEKLTYVEAILLLLGVDPQEYERGEDGTPREPPPGYAATDRALQSAIASGAIWCSGYPSTSPNFPDDRNRLMVGACSLKDWVSDVGYQTEFFKCQTQAAEVKAIGELTPPYLDPKHPRYSPKLAAAIAAWMEFNEVKGVHPRQVMLKWLNSHANELGLIHPDGELVSSGIKSVATVANWRRKGGAPTTPSKTTLLLTL